MPTSVRCAGPLIEGVVLRIVKLSSCGVAVTGTGSAVMVMDGFMKIMSAPQYQTGNRVVTRKANGVMCLNWKTRDQFTHNELTADFCVWHPGVPVNTIRARLLTATASPTGTGFAIGTQQNSTEGHFSLEVWQPPPQSCDSSGIVYYPYHAWPHLSDGKLGQFEISDEAQTTMQIMANTLDGSPLWTPGLTYLDANIEQGDHYLFNLQNDTPPPSACVIADYP